jgi:hypothetical protein
MDNNLSNGYKVRASGAVQYIEISVHRTEPTYTTYRQTDEMDFDDI